jgi:hypothetical protein
MFRREAREGWRSPLACGFLPVVILSAEL